MPNYIEGAGNIRHGDTWTWCPKLWSYLVDRYAIKSVLDVGCGEGHAVNYFRKLGVIAHGIDGSMDNVQRAVTPIQWHWIHNIPFVMPVDLVWCSEVAEHIPEENVPDLIQVLCNGKIIAFNAAPPGQGGYGHVNEQPATYWIDKFVDRDYTYHDYDTDWLREIAGEDNPNSWFARNGLVFFRNDKASA
jgi:SAM-dependent methyltransferase